MNRSSTESSRRAFLKGSAAVAAGFTVAAPGRAQDQGAREKPPLPTRKLGRSGIEVSVLNQGTAFRLTQRMLDFSYAQGIRYFDTADCYENGGSEREIAKWFERTGQRKEIFLVTKSHPTEGPKQLLDMVDERLEALKTDYIDLLFIHQIGDREYPESSVEWPKSDEFKRVSERLKKSGKCKLVGFSSHARRKAEYLTAAAEGGFVDAIMVKYDPRTAKNDEMNRALDRCVKAGIGLIAMKTQSSSANFKDRWEKLAGDKWTVQQAVVKAVLSDDRLAGMTSHMLSFKIIEENTAAARDAKPLAAADHQLLLDLYAAGPHRWCETCNGRCRAHMRHADALDDVARFVMYHDLYGHRYMARDHYRALRPEWLSFTADELETAKLACADGVDYPALVTRARKIFPA